MSHGWRYCKGSIPSKSCTSAVMKIYVHRPTDATQLVRLGKNIFHGEHHWQGFVCCSIAMAKRFLNYIFCNHFIRSVGANMKVVNLIQRLSSTVQGFLFLGSYHVSLVLILTPIHNLCVDIGQSARKSCNFVFVASNEVDVIC